MPRSLISCGRRCGWRALFCVRVHAHLDRRQRCKAFRTAAEARAHESGCGLRAAQSRNRLLHEIQIRRFEHIAESLKVDHDLVHGGPLDVVLHHVQNPRPLGCRASCPRRHSRICGCHPHPSRSRGGAPLGGQCLAARSLRSSALSDGKCRVLLGRLEELSRARVLRGRRCAREHGRGQLVVERVRCAVCGHGPALVLRAEVGAAGDAVVQRLALLRL